MKAYPFIVACSISLISSSALGDWSSGGGLVFKDEHNPWFIQNTKQVSYCIKRDENNFSVNESRLQLIITKALQYWKDEFKRSGQDQSTAQYIVKVATQNFIYSQCDGSQPLVFQFGWLSDEQLQRIAQPKQLVGVAVRTDYDVPTLKGKGFVYIAADSGPLKPEASGGPGQASLEDKFWLRSDQIPLLRAVVHELGHVFGIPHRGNNFALMGEGHLENLLSSYSSVRGATLENYRIPWMFNSQYLTNYQYCNSALPDLFGTPTGTKCIFVKGDVRKGFQVNMAVDENAPQQPFASVQFERFSSENYEELVSVYVPSNHPIFAPYVGYLRAVSWYNPYVIGGTLRYADTSRQSQPVIVHLGPNGFEVIGEKRNILDTIFGGYYQQKEYVNWQNQ